MLDRHPLYPCLMDAEGRVISFPPVTNSGVTRYKMPLQGTQWRYKVQNSYLSIYSIFSIYYVLSIQRFQRTAQRSFYPLNTSFISLLLSIVSLHLSRCSAGTQVYPLNVPFISPSIYHIYLSYLLIYLGSQLRLRTSSFI